jgi:uncharacterized membrane protein YcgQ (UPF0703/DUF1980 family)
VIVKREKKVAEDARKVQILKEKEMYEQKAILQKKEEIDAEKKKLDAKIEEFKKKVDDSEDLNDRLQDLVDHLAEFTGASASYIGFINKPIQGVKSGLLKEDADDTAHNIAGSKAEIQFLYASESCKEVMKDKVLL